MHKDIVNNGVVSKKVEEVKHPMVSYDNSFKSNFSTLIDYINAHVEGSSFLFKDDLMKHLPQMLSFLVL